MIQSGRGVGILKDRLICNIIDAGDKMTDVTVAGLEDGRGQGGTATQNNMLHPPDTAESGYLIMLECIADNEYHN